MSTITQKALSPLATLLFSLVWPGPVVAAPGSAKATTSVDYKTPGKKTEDLPNFHVVHPYLYRGGEPTAAGLKLLGQKGVKTVIDLRAASFRTKAEAEQAQALGMKHINLPMSAKAPTASQQATFIAAVEEGQKSNEPVFVHCAHGSDRAGCMVGIWRVTHDGYTYADAYKEMRKYYFGPQFRELSGAVQKRVVH